MTPKITEKKKDSWLSRLSKAQTISSEVYSEISVCGISDDKIESLSNLTCNFDEAYSEVDSLEEVQ